MVLDRLVRDQGGEEETDVRSLMTMVIHLMKGLRRSQGRLILAWTLTYIMDPNETILLQYHRISDYLSLELTATNQFDLEVARGLCQVQMVSC